MYYFALLLSAEQELTPEERAVQAASYGAFQESAGAYRIALDGKASEPARAFLRRRLEECGG